MGIRDKSNPYVGLSGFWNRWNRLTYMFSGAAQVGVGRGNVEAPEPAHSDRVCPLCGKPMDGHVIERGIHPVPTRIHCPV